MAVELFANLPSTTVTSGGTTAPAGGTSESWTVASSASFPAASSGASPQTQFHVADVAANSEIIAVTNVSGTTWTVTRGAESTTPVAHTAGFSIFQVVTAGALGSFAQLPSSNAWTGTNTWNGFSQFNAGPVLFACTLGIPEGSNCFMGTATLNGTTAVTVVTTAVAASSRIFLTTQTPAGTPGSPYVNSISAGASFTVKSTGGSDTSTVAWLIVNHT